MRYDFILYLYTNVESSDDDKEEDTFLPSESEGFLETDDDLGVDNDDDDTEGEGDSDIDEDDSSDSDSSEGPSQKGKPQNNHTENHGDAEDSSDFMDADDG